MQNKKRIVHFHKYDYENNSAELRAIISRYNAYFRVLDHENKEYKFREYTQAVKYLLDQGFVIECPI